MFVTIVLAALLVELLFSAAGLIPEARPSTEDVFGSIELDYKLILNLVALVAFAVLFGLTIRRGATDPVCGMRIDRSKALMAEHGGRRYHLCSEHCRQAFEAEPERYAGREREVSAPAAS
jgi:YHS domain-containing protein